MMSHLEASQTHRLTFAPIATKKKLLCSKGFCRVWVLDKKETQEYTMPSLRKQETHPNVDALLTKHRQAFSELTEAIAEAEQEFSQKDFAHGGLFAALAKQPLWLKTSIGAIISAPFVISGSIISSPLLVLIGVFSATTYGMQIATEDKHAKKSNKTKSALQQIVIKGNLFSAVQETMLQLLSVFDNNLQKMAKENEQLAKSNEELKQAVQQHRVNNGVQGHQIKCLSEKVEALEGISIGLKQEREELQQAASVLQTTVESLSRITLKKGEDSELFLSKLTQFLERKDGQFSTFLLAVSETEKRLRETQSAYQSLLKEYKAISASLETSARTIQQGVEGQGAFFDRKKTLEIDTQQENHESSANRAPLGVLGHV